MLAAGSWGCCKHRLLERRVASHLRTQLDSILRGSFLSASAERPRRGSQTACGRRQGTCAASAAAPAPEEALGEQFFLTTPLYYVRPAQLQPRRCQGHQEALSRLGSACDTGHT